MDSRFLIYSDGKMQLKTEPDIIRYICTYIRTYIHIIMHTCISTYTYKQYLNVHSMVKSNDNISLN